MRRWTVPRWSKSAVAQAAVFVLLVLALVGQVRGGEARLFVILPMPFGR